MRIEPVDLETLGRSGLGRSEVGSGRIELYLKRTRWRQVVRRSGTTETIVTGVETGCAVRVFLPDGRFGMHAFSDPDPDRTLAAVRSAREMAVLASPPAAPERLPAVPFPSDPGGGTGPAVDGEEFLVAAEAAARRGRVGIEAVVFSLCADGSTEIWIGNSAGMRGEYRKLVRHAVIGILPGGGHVHYHRHAAAAPARLDPDEFGGEAAILAAWPNLPAAPAPRGAPLVVHPAAAAAWVRRLSAAFVGPDPGHREGILPGVRPAAGFGLVDDGSLPGGIASAPFDGVGWPTRRRILVQGGKVMGRIAGSAAGGEAAECGGNLIRESFRDVPRPGPTNLFIPAGATAAGRILRRSPKAVLVLGLGPAAAGGPAAADLAISGCVLESGEPIGGISRAVVAGGNGALLRGLVDSASDLRFYPLEGSFGSPTLLIDRIGLQV